MNVMAIGAHPDDLESFCAGTLARCARRGDRVFMCVVTDGRGRPVGDPAFISSLRKAEAQASADVIGAQLVWLGIPDGELTVSLETRHVFVEAIRAARPELIITHPPEDYHPDHMATSQLVIEAAQIARTTNYRSSYPPLSEPLPVAYMDAELGIHFEPVDYVDITDVWPLKATMLLQHVSQFMPGPEYDPAFVMPPDDQNAFLRAVRVLSEFRGLACGVDYAEGFRWWHAAGRIVPRRLLP